MVSCMGTLLHLYTLLECHLPMPAFGKILSLNPEVGTLAKDAIVVYTAQLGNLNRLVVGLLAAGGVLLHFLLFQDSLWQAHQLLRMTSILR